MKDQLKKKYTDRKLTDQPLVVICGPVHLVTCCHLIYDDITFDFTKATEAVSFLSKMLSVLKVKFPLACPHIWGFFEKHVFAVSKEKKKVIASYQINAFINKLNKAD